MFGQIMAQNGPTFSLADVLFPPFCAVLYPTYPDSPEAEVYYFWDHDGRHRVVITDRIREEMEKRINETLDSD